MKTIDDFRQSDYRFLMNNYDSPILLDGETYPTVEHAYQASKTLDTNERAEIRQATTGRRSKRIGRSIALRPGWDAMREDVMLGLLESKFANTDLRALLLATQNAKLVSGGDTFWGEVAGAGDNRLGKLLTKVRANIVRETCDALNTANRTYLQAHGWTRNTSGDDVFIECWVPVWNKDCFFDLDSAVHYQNKQNIELLNTANAAGLLDVDVDLDDDDDDDDVRDNSVSLTDYYT
jgi:ribA/ribD-fused uncharacterized protein